MENTMKRMLSLLIVAVMVFGMIVPATPLHAHATEEAVDQVAFGKEVAKAAAQMKFPAAGENLDAQDKYFIADCPACGAKNAEWLARGQGSGHTNNMIEGAAGRHYYLVGDVTQIQKYSEGTTCVHLNGHNVTNETANAFLYSGAGENTLNIMGSGIVTGGRSDGNPVVANIYGTNPVLNLYGGTVKKVDIKYPMFSLGAGRTLNVYAGATLDGTGTQSSTNSAGVYVNGGNLNVYGGKIINGLGSNGNDVYAAAGNVKIEGAAVIGQMKVTSATVTYGTLTNGASITASYPAAGMIAAGKGAYAGKYIHSYVDGDSFVNAKNGNLTYSTAKLKEDANRNAYCAVCDAVVKWVSASDYSTVQTSTPHMFLTSSKDKTISLGTLSSGYGCFHLNGFTLSGSGVSALLFGAAGELNVMGGGSVVGKRDAAGLAVMNFNASNATLNLYANITATVSPAPGIIIDGKTDCIVNINDGGVIDMPGKIFRINYNATGSQINLNGGKIISGSTSACAVIEARTGAVTINSGTIQANSKWPIYMNDDTGNKGDGVFTMTGGEILGTNHVNSVYIGSKASASITGGTFAMIPNGNAGGAAGNTITNEDGTVTVMCAEHDACFDIPCAICGFDAYAGHDFQEGTCATCGVAQCEVEGHHCVLLEGKDATCTEDGLSNGWACDRCDYVRYEQEVIEGGHKYETVEQNRVEPSYEAAGSYDIVSTCSVCGDVKTETVVLAKLTRYADDLAFVADTNRAYCPVCAKDVEWTALAADAANALEGGKHYYLAEDGGINTASYMTMAAKGTACVHLNGHNITCAGGFAALDFALSATSTVNFMGTGIVATTSDGGQTLTMGNGGKAVLYSGTYDNNGAGAVAHLQTATLTVEPGVTVAGTIKLAHGDTGSKVYINGGNIENVTLAGSGNTLVLAGAPVIGELNVAAGQTATLGALTEGAQIAVVASGAFTVANENAEALVAYFRALDADANVLSVAENQLVLTAHDFYEEVMQEPTCTEPGEMYMVCMNCGEERTAEIPATGHQMSEEEEIIKNPTCTEAGLKGIVCAICGEGETAEIPATGHTLVAGEKTNVVEASYEAPGSYDITYACSACDYTETKTVQTAQKTHYTDNLIFVEGTKFAWCEVCQAEVKWLPVSKTSHVMSNWDVGDHYYVDVDITDDYTDSLISADVEKTVCLHLNGHNVTATRTNVLRVDAGCNVNVLGSGTVCGNGTYGSTVYVKGSSTLNLFGGTYTKADDQFTNIRTPMFMLNKGALNIFEGVTIEDRTYGETEVDGVTYKPSQPSIYANSADEDSVYIQGATINGKISMTAGQTVAVAGAAKITEVMVKTDKSLLTVGELTEGAEIGLRFSGSNSETPIVGPAADAGENAAAYIEAGYLKATGEDQHLTNVEGIVTIGNCEFTEEIIDATCAAAGEKKSTCTVCGFEKIEVIEQLEHNLVQVEAKDATCTEAGHEAYEYCTACTYTTLVEIPATGHTAGEVEIGEPVMPDCFNEGYYEKTTYCSVCGEVESVKKVITAPAAGHKAGEPVEEDGFMVTYCSVCGEEMSRAEIVPDVPDEPEEPAKDPVAEFNGEKFDSVAKALKYAYKNGGGIVKLIASATEEDIIAVKPGVTLDLNGYVLTALDSVLAEYDTAEIIDSARVSAKAGGQLLVADTELFLYESNEMLPVRRAEGTYEFAQLAMRTNFGSNFSIGAGEATFQAHYRGHADTKVTNKAYFQDLFKNNNASDLGLKIQLVIEGTKVDGLPGRFVFLADESQIKTLATGWRGAMTVTASGLGALTEYDIYLEIAFVGVNGTTVAMHDYTFSYNP